MTDRVAEALERAGDPAGSWLWRSVGTHLLGPLRVAIVGRDEGLVQRVARHLPEGTGWVPLVVPGEPGAEGDLPVQDRLLETHAVVFATPVTAPLGAAEREWLAALGRLGAPAERVVVVGDRELLARMSDDPDTEARDVAGRVASLVPADWRVVEETGLSDTVGGWRARLPALAPARRAEVGRILLHDALERAQRLLAAAVADDERVREQIRTEERAIDEAARLGGRSAAHLVSAARRQTEGLQVDLAAFLAGLEADLPAQLDAVPDVDLLRRALPHWLHHVVEVWLSDRVARWRADLEADITEIGIPADEIERAELVAPAVYARVPHASSGWGKRLGVTAAMGGGAALLVLGLWVPGLLAVSGGALFSALGRRAEESATRRALLDAAVDAVRRMGADADRLLREQIDGLQATFASLADDRRRAEEELRGPVRARLDEEAGVRARRVREATLARDQLRDAVAAVESA